MLVTMSAATRRRAIHEVAHACVANDEPLSQGVASVAASVERELLDELMDECDESGRAF